MELTIYNMITYFFFVSDMSIKVERKFYDM